MWFKLSKSTIIFFYFIKSSYFKIELDLREVNKESDLCIIWNIQLIMPKHQNNWMLLECWNKIK